MKSIYTPIIGLASAITLLTSTSCVDPYGPSQTSASVTTTYSTGSEIRTLPRGYRTEVISGRQYYIHNDTYYQPRSGRYVIVESPRRQAASREVYIDRLPAGYKMVRRDGRRYYQVNNTYYQQRGNRYVVVSQPF